MRRSLGLLLGSVLGFSCLAPTMASARDLRQVDPGMNPRQLCDNLLQVALRKIRGNQSVDDLGVVHARMQSGFPAAAFEAPVVIRALIGGGMGASGPAGLESVVAWRDLQGQWRARRAEEVSGGRAEHPERPLAPLWPDPDPKPQIEGYLPAPGNLRLSSGELEDDQAELLEKALLQESCIRLEPPVMPPETPLRGGGSGPCIPDSAWYHLEVIQNGQTRRYSRSCLIIGPVGLIARTMDGLSLPSAPVVRGRADLYNGSESAGPESLRQFLTDRLPGVGYWDAKGEGTIVAIRHQPPCAATLVVTQTNGEAREVVVNWLGVKSYASWIPDGVVTLTGEPEPSAWIAPSTTLALQLQGALWNLQFCGSEP